MTTDCVIWPKAKNNRGYGVRWFDGKLHLAHRVAWFEHHGRWPAVGLVLDHLCEVKACVRVDHLRESTNSANIRRAYPSCSAEVERQRERWRQATARKRARRAES